MFHASCVGIASRFSHIVGSALVTCDSIVNPFFAAVSPSSPAHHAVLYVCAMLAGERVGLLDLTFDGGARSLHYLDGDFTFPYDFIILSFQD